MTGNRPVQVFCADKCDYVVKPCNNFFPADKLAKELIAAKFAEAWDLETPAIKLITIKEQYYGEYDLSNKGYDIPCVGSKFSKSADDWDRTMFFGSEEIARRLINIDDLLKIVLFDIWTANEDRRGDNHNLLLRAVEKSLLVEVIDHESIFNARDFNNNRIYFDSDLEVPEGTLFNSASYTSIVRRIDQAGAKGEHLVQNLPNFAEASLMDIGPIIESFPEQWQVEKEQLNSYLNSKLLDEVWIEKVSDHFLSELQIILS